MKDRFFSLSLCLHLSLSLFLAGCVESERCFVCLQPGGKTELQSQAAKWWKTLASRDVLCLDQELRAREKCSLFNLTLFSYYISSLLLFSVSVFPSSGQAIFFSFFFMSACTAALEQVLLVGDGWMDEVVKRRRAKGWAENWMFTWVCVCVCVNYGDAVWPWACSFSCCHSNVPPNRSPVSVWTQWLLKAFKKIK